MGLLHRLFGYKCHHHPDVDGAPALDLENVVVRYPGSSAPALHGVSLHVAVGERIALVGTNGAGKSTLLRVAAGLHRAVAGQVRMFGNPPGTCYHRVAYLPQRSEIDWEFPITVRDFVMSGRYPHLGWFRRPADSDFQTVDETLGTLDLQPLSDRPIDCLSGGQQQRLLLARAMAQQARLFLLDEPFNALDAESRALLTGYFERLKEAGHTQIVATHDAGDLLADYDRVIRLEGGALVAATPSAS